MLLFSLPIDISYYLRHSYSYKCKNKRSSLQINIKADLPPNFIDIYVHASFLPLWNRPNLNSSLLQLKARQIRVHWLRSKMTNFWIRILQGIRPQKKGGSARRYQRWETQNGKICWINKPTITPKRQPGSQWASNYPITIDYVRCKNSNFQAAASHKITWYL